MAPSHSASHSISTLPLSLPVSAPDAPTTAQLTAEEIAAVTDLLARARRVLERGYVPLTDAERRFGARFRSGTEVVLRVLARVVDAQNVFLPAGLSIRAAQVELEAADELRPLAEAAADLSKLSPIAAADPSAKPRASAALPTPR